MSQHEYMLFSSETLFDDRADDKNLYLTKKFTTKYFQRIFLLTSGQLTLVDYVDYGEWDLPDDVANGKLVGKGFPHYILRREIHGFDSIAEAIKHPLLLKSKLLTMSQVLIKRNSDTGYYELVQGEELEAIFSAAKV
jgi:hypothetical protein